MNVLRNFDEFFKKNQTNGMPQISNSIIKPPATPEIDLFSIPTPAMKQPPTLTAPTRSAPTAAAPTVAAPPTIQSPSQPGIAVLAF